MNVLEKAIDIETVISMFVFFYALPVKIFEDVLERSLLSSLMLHHFLWDQKYTKNRKKSTILHYKINIGSLEMYIETEKPHENLWRKFYVF